MDQVLAFQLGKLPLDLLIVVTNSLHVFVLLVWLLRGFLLRLSRVRAFLVFAALRLDARVWVGDAFL